MKVEKIEKKIEIKKGIEISIDNNIVKIKGPKGEVVRQIKNPKVNMKIQDNNILVWANNATKREKKEVFTYTAHINNMMKGANEGHVYELKICSGHFPMNVSVSGDELTIKNFIGEKAPRKLKLKDSVSVKINGDKIIVEHVNKETAGQTAASIEQLTRRHGFDTRIFQDGIYITKKDGKEMA